MMVLKSLQKLHKVLYNYMYNLVHCGVKAG